MRARKVAWRVAGGLPLGLGVVAGVVGFGGARPDEAFGTFRSHFRASAGVAGYQGGTLIWGTEP